MPWPLAPSAADALARRKRGFELIKQNAGRLSGEADSANRRMLTTFKKYSDPGIYHRWVVGALENVGTDAVPEVADLLRVMKDAHPKSGAIMLERIGAGLRAAGAQGGTRVGPAGRAVDREDLIAGLTDHFHGTRPEPDEVGRGRLTTAPGRAGPAAVRTSPLGGSGGRDTLAGGAGTDTLARDTDGLVPGRAAGLVHDARPFRQRAGGPSQAGLPSADPKTTPAPKRPESIDPFGYFFPHHDPSGPGKTGPTPFGPGVRSQVPTIADKVGALRRMAQKFRDSGLRTAARHLEHYLEGSGDYVPYTREQARQFKPVLTAEVENRERFETGTFLGKTDTREDLNRKFRNLKDGEAFTETDHFDYEFDISDLVYRGLTGDRDFALAFGRNALKSAVIFTARRVGDLIYIEGTVTHAWEHVYDFEPGQPASEFALAAKAHAGAADFKYGATWFQRFSGTVQVKHGIEAVRGGVLRHPDFVWEDADARDRM